jgi:hypothetical protein
MIINARTRQCVTSIIESRRPVKAALPFFTIDLFQQQFICLLPHLYNYDDALTTLCAILKANKIKQKTLFENHYVRKNPSQKIVKTRIAGHL